MKDKFCILVADDDARHRQMLVTLLEDWGYEVIEARDGREAVNLCRGKQDKNSPDLALMDVRMPGKNGLEAMADIKKFDASLPIVIMTAYSDIPDAVGAIRNGAWDYLTKPLDFDKLQITIRNVAAHLGLMKENANLAACLEKSALPKSLLGKSRVMAEVGELIRAIAPTEATVLITGESGTGKELAAKSIHMASKRANGPFVAVNCGALTESLLASELFGHEKGAFTGADRKHPGFFAEAEGGSIFLDEIGEMPPSMQVKLLRVLQEKEVLSVGGKKPRPINCRIIAATNRDLAREVEEGKFRQDLYYRLNVVSLNMPSLRERTDDIPAMAKAFADRFASANSKKFEGFLPEAMELLLAWHWPGNVRELENVVERAIILMPGQVITARELPERIVNDPRSAKAASNGHLNEGSAEEREATWENDFLDDGEASFPTLEEVERRVILQTLKKMGNNKTETAKALGITRKTLHAKLNRYREDEGSL